MAAEKYTGSMDDMDGDEIKLRLAAHGGTMMGQFVMQSREGDVVATAPITFDHQTIGSMLNSDAGTTQSETALHQNLSDEQAALLRQMERWRDDPEIDFA